MEYGRSGIYRSSCLQVFFKMGVLKSFTIFVEKHLCRSLFLSCRSGGLQLHQKETPTQVFSCEYCCYRIPLMAASGFLTKLAENNWRKSFLSRVFLRNYFLVLAAAFLNIIPLQIFCSFCISLNMSEVYLEPSQTSRWSLLQK